MNNNNGKDSGKEHTAEQEGDQCKTLYKEEDQNRKRLSFQETENDLTNNDRNSIGDTKLLEIPSQAICLSTTVPQNIASQRLGGKHTPTRNSLRHSRMIVLNRSGKVPIKYLPTIVKHRKLAKALVVSIILLGCLLTTVSLMLQLWAPNLRPTDNPYWSAVLVVVSGIAGAIFICFCPKEYPGRRFNWFFYSIKYLSITTSIVAIVATFVIFTFATLHVINLANTECRSSNKFNTACICSPKNDTSTFIKTYDYVDLNCTEVEHLFNILMCSSCVLNAVLCVLEVAYLILHYRRRYTYTYAKVASGENGNVAKSNGNS